MLPQLQHSCLVVGAVAVALNIAPVALTIPVVLAASCAFMLPVATPPNAIVFGSGKAYNPRYDESRFCLKYYWNVSGNNICVLSRTNDILRIMFTKNILVTLFNRFCESKCSS